MLLDLVVVGGDLLFPCRDDTDEDAAAIRRIAGAADISGVLETVEYNGDSTGGETAELAEGSRGHGTEQVEQIQELHIGRMEAEFFGDSLAEEAGAGDEQADGAGESREEPGFA